MFLFQSKTPADIIRQMSDLNASNTTQSSPYRNFSRGHANVSQPLKQTQGPAANRQHMSYQQDPKKLPSIQGMARSTIRQQSLNRINTTQNTQSPSQKNHLNSRRIASTPTQQPKQQRHHQQNQVSIST